VQDMRQFLKRPPFAGPVPVCLAFTLVSLLYAWVTPPLEVPDVRAHLTYAAWLQDEGQLPTPLEAARNSHEMVEQPPLYYALVAFFAPTGSLRAALDATIHNPLLAQFKCYRGTIFIGEPPLAATLGLLSARLVSWMAGLTCIIASALWVHTLLPGSRGAPCWSAAVAASNAVFIAQSTGITNDSAVAAGAALAVWMGSRAYRRPDATERWLLAGAAAGLATMAKYSGAVVLGPLLMLCLVAPGSPRRSRCRACVCLAAGFILTAGPMLALNLLQYGEPVPLRSLASLIPDMVRVDSLSVPEAVNRLGGVWRSYWNSLDYGLIVPAPYTWIPVALVLGSLAGYVLSLFKSSVHRDLLVAGAVCLVWLAASALSLVSWIRTMEYSDQGRLLFCAASGVSGLIGIGLAGGIDSLGGKARGAAQTCLALLLVVLAIWPVTMLARAYHAPEAVQAVAPDRLINHTYENGARLVGIDLPRGANIKSGEVMPIDLYLTADAQIASFDLLVVQLVGTNDEMLFYYDGTAAPGWPPPMWEPGQVFRCHYDVHVPAEVEPGLAWLLIGFRQHSQQQGDVARVAPVRILADQQVRVSADTAAEWDNGIVLLSARPLLSEDALVLDMLWSATGPVHLDYTMSLQAYDSMGRLVAQYDAQPQNGEYPTSTWSERTIVSDTMSIEPLPEAWQDIGLVLYDALGHRVPEKGSHADVVMLLSRAEMPKR